MDRWFDEPACARKPITESPDSPRRFMKLRFLILILFLAVVTPPALPQQPQQPLTKGQVMNLVKYGMSGPDLAEKIKKLGIDFDPTDDYIQALRNAGAQDVVIQALGAARPKPLTQDQVGKLVAGGVPSERAAMLVKQRGIDFLADEEYLNTLRLAGGNDTLIAAVREASAAATAALLVETSPNAEVYLDRQLQGHADAQGELTIKAKLGTHALKVSLDGKKNFEQSLTVPSVQPTKIEARLVDAPGSIRVRTLAGASILLDGASRGSTDASGELVLADLSPGPHELRVSAPEKREYLQSVTVTPGQESGVEATLQDAPPSPGQGRENPKDGLKYVWIPPGTFMMGCSPGDNECSGDEKPAHQVTITKGFWMTQAEVTVDAYKRFAAATGRQMPNAPNFNSGWENDAMPIVMVTWNEAHDYCTWAGGRLPTEAEWEYAARAGSTAARYGDLDDISWYADNSGRQRLDGDRIWKEAGNAAAYGKRLNENGNRTHEVGQKRANGFGLYDVLGNVLGWVNDWYDQNYYQNSPSQDPSGPPSGQYRVLRGGSWLTNRGLVRVSYRNCRYPDDRDPQFGLLHGVRCGREVFAP
jgi:formylglycine-generating enzyme required for sulfatase activity